MYYLHTEERMIHHYYNEKYVSKRTDIHADFCGMMNYKFAKITNKDIYFSFLQPSYS